ncbi:hypothetical protein BVRB_2g025040 [Beta vulgaris subsp. vulgaris]|nr:hypothetical protein BVRB_2g025040 [Beta vulgaris subsp. vulgaris]
MGILLSTMKNVVQGKNYTILDQWSYWKQLSSTKYFVLFTLCLFNVSRSLFHSSSPLELKLNGVYDEKPTVLNDEKLTNIKTIINRDDEI